MTGKRSTILNYWRPYTREQEKWGPTLVRRASRLGWHGYRSAWKLVRGPTSTSSCIVLCSFGWYRPRHGTQCTAGYDSLIQFAILLLFIPTQQTGMPLIVSHCLSDNFGLHACHSVRSFSPCSVDCLLLPLQLPPLILASRSQASNLLIPQTQ
ncbi:hypothetical protein EDB84DRAFT_1455259 [Lactarius hengduanensis]|nr:hypothetical protein EDB84DRAFT_1455259 [Lactarius hengduanensis]